MAEKEAMFYEKLKDDKVHCYLCPHHCHIPRGDRGICGVRKNIDGTLYSLNYGEVSSIAIDPIEKKPLKNFYPGSIILSVGSVGCNLKCPFCQNHRIARVKSEEVNTLSVKSDEIVEKAVSLKEQGNIGIAYTYNEPSIWYEFVYDTSKLAKKKGLVNVLVTNGFISRGPLEEILPYIDAMNIDLKAFSDQYYHDVVKGNLDNVKETINISAEKCHVELTTLVVPGLNDSVDEIKIMAEWISSVSPDIPLHLSRFFPQYDMTDKPPTPLDTLIRLEKEAKKHLDHVYLGNV
jgi:Pyruvate-formate lyase-activating enzyme